jgi:hypothetical protein
MVTNYPQRLTATTTTADRAAHAAIAAGFLSRFAVRISQAFCAMRGHDSVLHFEGNRVMMRCTSCGHDSPGWEISGRAPRQRFEGDRRRHALTPQRLVLRKTA